MPDTAIKVKNLSKRYRIGAREGFKTFRETLVDAAKAPFRRIASLGKPVPSSEMIWALKDVSFEVKKGEVLGIIGRNGAGKTTLLKILSRITEPTKGRIELRGKVGSLLEVGTGFHSELSGHENVYLYGAILGMDRYEITRKFDEIIAFAEVEKFVDTPVKRYSSGMHMRLAFSVAAHLEPEILLVDEVLAVGDAIFQRKCMKKMEKVAEGGRTVLFVSHNMAAISSTCHRGIVLDEGRLLFDGKIQDAINFYEGELFNKKYLKESISKRKDRTGTGEVKVVSFHIENEKGEKIERIPNGHTVKLVFGYQTSNSLEANNVDLAIIVEREKGERAFQLGTRFTGQKFKHLPPQGFIVCVIKKFPLVAGRYNLGAYLHSQFKPSDFITSLTYLDVIDGDFYDSGYQVYQHESIVLVDGTWSFRPHNSK